MSLSRRRRRLLSLGLAGALATATGLVLGASGALDRVEMSTIDQRFQNRGTHDRPDDIVVVGVQQQTFAALGAGFPLKRSFYARAIRNLTTAGAKLIVIDIQFSEPTEPFDASAAAQAAAEAEDLELLDAITASKRVVLAVDEVTENGPNLLFVDEDLAAAEAAVGLAVFDLGSSRVFRKVPDRIAGFPSLAVAAVEKLTGARVPADGFTDGQAWIDYHGPTGEIRQVPFEAAALGTLAPGDVDGAVVVIGNTANNLNDVEPTPFGDVPMSGAEIHANAISTIRRGVPLRDAPGWLNVIVLLLLTGLVTAAALTRRVLVGFIGGLALLVGYGFVAQLIFNGGRIIDVAAPLVSGVLALLAGLALNYALVVRDRRRLRTEFGRFLPARLVDEMIDEADDAGRLGGRRVYATVLFADLRGFTATAEQLPPELVIESLNRYLTEMGDAVLDHGGTLVSYQGDGIMAVFGAPVEATDHADRALAAAIEMRDVRLPAFNAWARTAGLAGGDVAMGIGLASGPVMSGTVGSERRREYAAVGDTTNAAARLQSMTKETGHALLVADATRAALTRPVTGLQAVGSLDVRGRQVPTSVWTVAQMGDGPAAAGPSDPPG